jgi:hypothetical protein
MESPYKTKSSGTPFAFASAMTLRFFSMAHGCLVDTTAHEGIAPEDATVLAMRTKIIVPSIFIEKSTHTFILIDVNM